MAHDFMDEMDRFYQTRDKHIKSELNASDDERLYYGPSEPTKMKRNKQGFPVEEAAENYLKQYGQLWDDIDRRKVRAAFQTAAEWGYMRGYEAARKQGQQ